MGMDKPGPSVIVRLGVDDLTPPFKRVSVIRGEGVELRLVDKFLLSGARVPCYEFSIFVDGNEAGIFHVRIERDFEKVREVGNVGIETRRKFYGHDLPTRATKAAFPFFRKHGIHSILITHDKGKRAIRRSCDQLGASHKDTIDVPELGIQRERFILDF
jgi:predicted acetyltransferase